MIDTSLNFIAKELNYYLQRKFDIDDDKVIVNYLVNDQRSIKKVNQNKIVFTLLNIEKDISVKNFGYGKRSETPLSQTQVPQNYRVEFLLASNFEDYREALKFLEEALSFFNENTVFSKQSAPNMPSTIDRLSIEVENTGYEQLQSIWSVLGTTLKPSVVFKLHILGV